MTPLSQADGRALRLASGAAEPPRCCPAWPSAAWPSSESPASAAETGESLWGAHSLSDGLGSDSLGAGAGQKATIRGSLGRPGSPGPRPLAALARG